MVGNRLLFTLGTWPAVTGVALGLSTLVTWLAPLLGFDLPEQANLQLVRSRIGANAAFAWLCAQVLVLAPLLEETVFRWLLFKFVLRLRGAWRPGAAGGRAGLCAAAVVSAALFTAAHYLCQPWPDAAFLSLFFIGLAQAWLYWRTDRLWCVVLNHALFNLTNLVILCWASSGAGQNL